MTQVHDDQGKFLRRRAAPLFISVAVLAGAIAAVIGALSLADGLTASGLPDPGRATSYGLPFVRAAGEIAAVVAIGNFLLSAFFVPPQPNGVLDVDGYRALRLGGVACALWAACAALMIPLSISDVSGLPLQSLGPLDVWSAAGLVETTSAWRWTAMLAALVAAASALVLRWKWMPALALGASMTLMPQALTGHSSSGGAHDIATNSLLIHLVAAALWVGGLLALIIHVLRGGGHIEVAARRFSAVALWCFVAVATSGVLNAAVRIAPADILTSNYGRLLIAKGVALCGLGVLGWRQRRSMVASLRSSTAARGTLLRLSLAEIGVFAATFGLAVGLGRTPAPVAVTEPTAAEAAIGFDLAVAPTLLEVLINWRFDLVFGTASIVLGALYLAGVSRVRRRGDCWAPRRTCSWLLGCVLMLVATSSGLGSYMPAMFSMHMLVQVIMAMVVPVLLVSGTPVTLSLRALHASGDSATPGLREWLVSSLNSSLARFLTSPTASLLLFVGGGYGLYFAGAFDLAITEHVAHVVMTGFSVLSGVLFFSVVLGVEPSIRGVSLVRRLLLAVVGLLQHIWIGIVVRDRQPVLGESFYRSLRLDWHTDLLADQRLGGELLSLGAAVMLLVVAGGLFSFRDGYPKNFVAVPSPRTRWLRSAPSTQHRH